MTKVAPAAALAILALATPAHAAADAALAARLQARTQAMADAIVRADKAVWDAALDPAVIYVTENNLVMDKAAVLADLAPVPPEITGHTTVTDYRLQRHGDVAVATYVNDERLTYYGQPLATRFRVTDTWHQGADGQWRIVASQTLAVLGDPPAITLSPTALAGYAGRYRLTDAVGYTVTVVGGKLMGQRSGGQPVELRAEAPDLFFVPGRPRSRKVFLRDAGGRITGFADRREGQDVRWTRLP